MDLCDSNYGIWKSYFGPLGVNFKCGTQGQESHINSDIARPATKEKLDS